jgi:hypothetical protein
MVLVLHLELVPHLERLVQAQRVEGEPVLVEGLIGQVVSPEWGDLLGHLKEVLQEGEDLYVQACVVGLLGQALSVVQRWVVLQLHHSL